VAKVELKAQHPGNPLILTWASELTGATLLAWQTIQSRSASQLLTTQS